jgi:hypothetical protein
MGRLFVLVSLPPHASLAQQDLASDCYCGDLRFPLHGSLLRVPVQVWLLLALDHSGRSLQYSPRNASSLSLVQLWIRGVLPAAGWICCRPVVGRCPPVAVHGQSPPLNPGYLALLLPRRPSHGDHHTDARQLSTFHLQLVTFGAAEAAVGIAEVEFLGKLR